MQRILTIDGSLDEHLLTVNNDGSGSFYDQGPDGSVVHVFDETGSITQSFQYSGYGLRNGGVQGTFGYHGLLQDVIPGLVYSRARWYRPDLGRFLTVDPIGLLGGSNLYGFAGSAPLMLIDPLGFSPAIPQAESAAASFWRAGGSLLGTGYAMHPGPGAGLYGNVPVQSMLNASSTSATGAGVAVPAAGAAGGAVAGGAWAAAPAAAAELELFVYSMESWAAVHPGWVTFGTAYGLSYGGNVLGPTAPVASEIAGAGGSWPVINEAADPNAVQQINSSACGPACAVMLLRGLGQEVTQPEVAAAAAADNYLTFPGSLAYGMNQLAESSSWVGQSIADESLAIAAKRGPFAAMLGTGTEIGHWVVVDSIEDGVVGIRDPAQATSYLMDFGKFLEAWRGFVVRQVGRSR